MIESNVGSASPSDRVTPGVGVWLIVSCFVLLAASVAVGKGTEPVALLLMTTAAFVAWHRWMLRWTTLVCVVVGIVLFIPIGRFSLPINLPFGLEPYRLAVALILAGWCASLLVDRAVRLRSSPLDPPIVLIVTATLAGIAVNAKRVIPLESAVLKSVTFFLSFVLVYYFIVSVLRTRGMVETVAKFLVFGTGIVGLCAIIEQRTRYNVFDHASMLLPFLQFQPYSAEGNIRLGFLRAMGSAGHPIALGVLLAMVFPLGLALAYTKSYRWWIPTVFIFIGILTTGSRTAFLSLTSVGLVLLWLRGREVVRLLPLVVPLVIVVKLVVPGSLATLKNSFFPKNGLIAEQSDLGREADPLLAGGRIRLLEPMLREASQTPLLGQGLGTRQTGFNNPLRNAPILDDQWLGLLLELGLVGLVGWAWLILRSVRKLAATSRTRDGPDGWLPAAFAASIAGFAIGMFTYDSLAFVQETFIFWVVVALSASLVLAESRAPVRAASELRHGGWRKRPARMAVPPPAGA
jgi:O-Antigen ligase